MAFLDICFRKSRTNAGLLRYVSPVQMVSRRFVNGILRKPELILVPLYENKKSLSVSGLDFLGVT